MMDINQDRLRAAGAAVLVVVLSILVGRSIADGSTLLVGAVLAAVIGWAIIVRPVLALLLVVVTTLGLPWELGGTGGSVVRLTGVMATACYALKVLYDRRGIRFASFTTLPFVCFLAWRSIEILRTRSEEALTWVSTAGSMLEYYSRLAMYLALYLLILNICRKPRDAKAVAVVIVATAAASAAFAFLIYFGLVPALVDASEVALLGGRIAGLRANPNEAATIATMALGLVLPFLLVRIGRTPHADWFDRLAARRVVVVGIFVLLLAAIVLSGSRGAIFVVFAMLLVSGVLFTMRGMAMTMLAAAALALVVVLAPLDSEVTEHFKRFPVVSDLIYGESVFDVDSSAAGRYQRGMLAFELIGTNPLAGVGFGNYEVLMGERLGYGSSAHNLYAEVLGEEGLVGLALYLWLTFAIARRLAVAAKYAGEHDPMLRLLVRAFFCSFIGFAVDRFFGNGDQLNKIIFLYLGMADVLAEMSMVPALRVREAARGLVSPASAGRPNLGSA